MRTACGSSTPPAASSSTRTRSLDALQSGKLAGAALDVFSSEPYPARCSSSTTSSPRRTSPPRPRRRRTAPASSSPSRSPPRSTAGSSRTRSTSRSSAPRTLEVLGPFMPLAARLGRLAMELADGAADGSSSSPTAARRLRHAAAHRRRAERRLQGTRRPAGQLRQRAADRAPSAASRCGRSARASRATTRTSSASSPHGRRRSRVAGTTIGATTARGSCSALGFEIELELAPLLVLCRYDDVPASSAASGRCSARGASTSPT